MFYPSVALPHLGIFSAFLFNCSSRLFLFFPPRDLPSAPTGVITLIFFLLLSLLSLFQGKNEHVRDSLFFFLQDIHFSGTCLFMPEPLNSSPLPPFPLTLSVDPSDQMSPVFFPSLDPNPSFFTLSLMLHLTFDFLLENGLYVLFSHLSFIFPTLLDFACSIFNVLLPLPLPVPSIVPPSLLLILRFF